MKIFCYHHSKDLDGLFSGAVVKYKYPEAEMCGFDYGDKVKLVEGYDLVIMADISLPITMLERLKNTNKKFVWIDHHARTIREAEDEGREFDGIRDKDNEYSACVLTWKYLYPNESIPSVLYRVQDQDLWRFKLKDTEVITAGIYTLYADNMEALVGIVDDYEVYYDDLWEAGTTILKQREQQVNVTVANAEVKRWNGNTIGLSNTNSYMSNVGHELLKENISFAVVWHIKKGIASVSLRSSGKPDVSEIASRYGGGGHPQASGFNMEAKKWFKEMEGMKNE